MSIFPAFDLPSAKNMSIETAVAAFVPTRQYWQMLHADTHDVIFGTRGSGKTMLLRMMSLQHLAEFSKRDREAHNALYQSKRLGLYVPLGLDWCVAYQDDSPDTFNLFLDGVNLVAADCLVDALDHLIHTDVIPFESRSSLERSIVEQLYGHWFKDAADRTYSLAALRILLLRQQAILRDVWRGRTSSPDEALLAGAGYHFRGSSLLRPLADAIQIANPLLGLPPEHRWIVCLDELEDLKPQQTRAIMTLLRGVSPNIALKVTTQPYTLDSADTAFSSSASAVDFRDFEIRRLQHDPAEKSYRDLVARILRKRIRWDSKLSGEKLGEKIFGKSTLADRANDQSSDFADVRKRLMSSADNPDSARKKVPVLAIRHLRRASEGHGKAVAYAGWDTIVRASDGNPGMFVRILNAFFLEQSNADEIPASKQHEVLEGLASNWHEWSRALYSEGAVLHQLIDRLGTMLSQQLHNPRIRDEQVPSEVNRFYLDLSEMEPATREAFKVAARHSLFIAETLDGSVRYPSGRGVWRLSYALAPKYWLLLRRGRIAKLGVRQLVFNFGQRATPEALAFGDDFVPVDRLEASAVAEDTEV